MSYVNAPVLAAERGVAGPAGDRPGQRGLPQRDRCCAARSPTAREVSVAGTLTGPKQVEKIVGVNGVDLEVAAVDAHGVLPLRRPARRHRRRRPACSATPGSTSPACRSAGTSAGERRVVALTVDSAIPAGVLAEIADEIGAETARGRGPVRRGEPAVSNGEISRQSTWTSEHLGVPFARVGRQRLPAPLTFGRGDPAARHDSLMTGGISHDRGTADGAARAAGVHGPARPGPQRRLKD